MNTTFKFINIIGVAFLLCNSCAKVEQTWPIEGDNSIRFGVSAGFEVTGLNTKTIYEGNGDFGYTDENGSKYENIYWDYDSDKIDVYCPQSPISRAHYVVKKDATTQGAYLERIGEASIQWAGDDITHNFYAMYPSVKVFEGDELTTINEGIMMDGTTLKGVVPTLQNPVGDITSTKSGDNYRYVAKPNMKYAYMAAKGTATKSDGQGVSLVFHPIVTALQVELRMANGTAVEDIKIGEIYLDGEGIAGNFSADLSSTGWTGDYPTCSNIGTGADRITISTWQTKDGVKAPLTLSAGDSFVFTVFLRPGQGISDLKVTISETGGVGLSKTMKDYTITPNVKTVVKNFMLPAIAIEVDNSNWLDPLPGETELKSLSIPGTGNSFSYLHSDATARSQKLTFDQQWAMGIRAFEITTCRQATNFTDEVLRCNGNEIKETINGREQNLTVGKVFTMMKDKLTSSSNVDFAMVILNYQPTGGDEHNNRNVDDYSKKVAKFYEENEELFVLYSPDKTLDDVRGKIMLVMKTNQEDEDYDSEYETIKKNIGQKNIVAINGCGSAKDKWRRRGYQAYDSNNILHDAYNIWDSGKGVANETDGILIEDYMISTLVNSSNSANINNFTWNNWTSKVVLPEEDYPGNFSYECTNGGSTNTFSVWYQEWARVVPEGGVKKYIGYCETETSWWGTRVDSYTHYAVYWHESYGEKLNNAKKAFQLAVNGGVTNDKQHIIFNSLCGYFVDGTQNTYSNSCFPYMQSPDDGHSHEGDALNNWDGYGGNKGDIGKLAAKLNNDFYNYILELGLNNSSGPTGVVLMDYLSNSSADGGSYYLPGVIIGNNFKYNVGTSDKTSGIGSVEDWEVETLN